MAHHNVSLSGHTTTSVPVHIGGKPTKEANLIKLTLYLKEHPNREPVKHDLATDVYGLVLCPDGVVRQMIGDVEYPDINFIDLDADMDTAQYDFPKEEEGKLLQCVKAVQEHIEYEEFNLEMRMMTLEAGKYKPNVPEGLEIVDLNDVRPVCIVCGNSEFAAQNMDGHQGAAYCTSCFNHVTGDESMTAADEFDKQCQHCGSRQFYRVNSFSPLHCIYCRLPLIGEVKRS